MSDAVAEIADLRALLAARDAELATARAELTGARLLIAQYQAQLAKLRRMQFGRSSETLEAEIRQLELLLEDLEEARRPTPHQFAFRKPRGPNAGTRSAAPCPTTCRARRSCMRRAIVARRAAACTSLRLART